MRRPGGCETLTALKVLNVSIFFVFLSLSLTIKYIL
jgi:hypothetical protein